MKIPVTLNGTKTILDAHADESLMKVLHKNGCISVKSGCSSGFCGSCTILLDDHPASSFKIPAAIVRHSDIVTLYYLPKREEIADYVKALSPCCTDLETLVNGILYSVQIFNKRQMGG